MSPVHTIYIDVDGTLIDEKGNLLPGVEAKLQQWRWKEKYNLICWSHTGGEYAERVCKHYDILCYFDHFLDKPDIIIDNDPTMIMNYPAVITIKSDQDWLKPDSELFDGSRHD